MVFGNDTVWYGEGMYDREGLEEMEDRDLLNAYTDAVHSYVTTNCI